MSVALTLVLDVWAPTRGGLEHYAEALLVAMQARGFMMRLVCGEQRAEVPAATEVEVLGGRGPRFYRRLDRRGARADELLLHFRHPGALPGVFLPLGGLFAAALDARRSAEAPWLRPCKRLARRLDRRTRHYLWRERAFFARPGVVFASSTLTADEIRRRHPRYEGEIQVTGLPVDAERYRIPTAAERSAARRLLGFDAPAKVLLWLGHDPVRKGLPVAMEVLRRLRQGGHEAWLLCAGHGTEVLDRREPGLRGLGRREDVPQLLQAADLLLLPSLEDNLSFVVLEALASGLPVVTTSCNGAASYLRSPEIGVVVTNPTDVDRTEQAVLALLAEGMLDEPWRDDRRQAVAACFAERHWASMAERFAAVTPR